MTSLSPGALWWVLKHAFIGWWNDNVPRLGASLAYYTLFALAPILIVAIAVAGLVFGEQAVRGQIVGQISGLVGEKLKGPTGLVFGTDPVAAAKVLSDFAKENEQRPTVKGGLLDGKALDPAQVKQLASLPSREQMLADLGAGLMSPMAAFVGALNGLMYMFAGALDALKSQREGA